MAIECQFPECEDTATKRVHHYFTAAGGGVSLMYLCDPHAGTDDPGTPHTGRVEVHALDPNDEPVEPFRHTTEAAK